MTLEQLDGVANSGFGIATEPLTWETATDWDDAVDEQGVVHESNADADYNDASLLEKGYPTGANAPLGGDNVLSYLLHETSGSTANDASGNGRDGTYDGPTKGQTGLLGHPCPEFDANNDRIDNTYGPYGNAPFSVVGWIGGESQNNNVAAVVGNYDGSFPQVKLVVRDGGNARFRMRDSGGSDGVATNTSIDVTDGNWHMLVGTYNPATDSVGISVDGGGFTTVSDDTSDTNLNSGSGVRVGARLDGAEWYTGRIGYMAWFDKFLSGSEIDLLYDTVLGESYLETATKSFTIDTQPDLQDLDYSLNGQSITVDVIGSPGTGSEEVVSQVLGGAAAYDLAWSASHTDFRVKPRLSSTDPETTPSVNRIELVTP